MADITGSAPGGGELLFAQATGGALAGYERKIEEKTQEIERAVAHLESELARIQNGFRQLLETSSAWEEVFGKVNEVAQSWGVLDVKRTEVHVGFPRRIRLGFRVATLVKQMEHLQQALTTYKAKSFAVKSLHATLSGLVKSANVQRAAIMEGAAARAPHGHVTDGVQAQLAAERSRPAYQAPPEPEIIIGDQLPVDEIRELLARE